MHHPKYSDSTAHCLLNTCLGHLLTPDQRVGESNPKDPRPLRQRSTDCFTLCRSGKVNSLLSSPKIQTKTINRRGSCIKLELLLKYGCYPTCIHSSQYYHNAEQQEAWPNKTRDGKKKKLNSQTSVVPHVCCRF